MVENLENQLKAALRVEVPAGSREKVRARVMKGAEQVVPRRRESTRRWRLLKPLPLAAALVLLLFVGTALAATGARPDSWLYPLKQKAEDARVILAFQGLDKAKVEVGRAHKRLDEIEQMVASGKPEYVPGLLARYNSHMTRAEELVNDAAGRGEAVDQVKEMIAAARARHDDLMRAMLDSLPEDVADDVRRQLDECQGCPVSGGGEAANGMPGGSGDATGMNEGMPGSPGNEMMPTSGSDETMPEPESGGYMEPGGSMGPSPGGVMDGGGMPSGTNGGMPSSPESGMGSGDPGGGGTGGGMSQPAPSPSAGTGSGGMSPGPGRH